METTKAELTMPDRLDPTDSKSWQHHLYRLGSDNPVINAARTRVVLTRQFPFPHSTTAADPRHVIDPER